jgi:hypothetical protein
MWTFTMTREIGGGYGCPHPLAAGGMSGLTGVGVGVGTAVGRGVGVGADGLLPPPQAAARITARSRGAKHTRRAIDKASIERESTRDLGSLGRLRGDFK